MNIKNLKEMILNTSGKFFVVHFIKANGEMREMIGRLGVEKHLKGGRTYSTGTYVQSTTAGKENLVTIFDTVSEGYRSINLEKLEYFKCGNVEWKKGGNLV